MQKTFQWSCIDGRSFEGLVFIGDLPEDLYMFKLLTHIKDLWRRKMAWKDLERPSQGILVAEDILKFVYR